MKDKKHTGKKLNIPIIFTHTSIYINVRDQFIW